MAVECRWNSFFGRFQLFLDYAVQTAGPMYIVLAFSLISCVIYLFFTAVLPASHNFNSWQGMGHILIAGWLTFNIFFNYLYCIYTDPGNPPPTVDPGPDSKPVVRYEMAAADETPSPARWCKRCHKPKPPMTHHCHICKRCILKMDHHCPWMHNCIGFYNYRFFFVFLLYLWTGCLYTTIMASTTLFGSINELQGNNSVLFAFVLSVAVLGSLSCLLGWHVYLVMSAQTTIDFYTNRHRRRESQRIGEVWLNEFDVGKLQNLRNAFDVGGRCWWLRLLLPTNAPPKGDGICFPTRPRSYDNTMEPLISGHYRSSVLYNIPSSSVKIPSTSSNTPDKGSKSRERTLGEGPWGPPDMD